MTRPSAYLWRMIVFLVLVAGVGWLVWPQFASAFITNPVLSGVICGVALLGVAWNIRQVAVLAPEVRWLEAFRASHGLELDEPAPKLLGPMAAMLAQRRGQRLSLSASSMRSVLDGIASRLDESRELSRYMTGLLIFLGLLGTFWGLLLTISSVSDVISGMSVGSGDINQLFNQLKTGLTQPLRGMGTAFASSMLGLSGALVLGFLDLTAGQAQTRFFNELEEWLAGQTRLSSGILGGEGEGSVPHYVQALLEQNAENLEQLQHVLARGEEYRMHTNQMVEALAERLHVLGEQMRVSLAAMQRSAEEASHGRIQAVHEIRSEIKVLTRTLAGLNTDQRR
jgi:hypothetical protein